MQQLKEYVPIVLTDMKLKPRRMETEYTSEKLPVIDTTQRVAKLSTHLADSRTSSLNYIVPYGVKPIVFPNILRKTKEDMKKLRAFQLAQLHDDGEAPLATVQCRSEIKGKKAQKDKSTTKMYTQVSKNSFNKPIITELSVLAQDNYSISPRSDSFKFRSLSPDVEGQLWQINNKVNRINKAYEIQKEIHHLERFKTMWKTDVIQQYLQQKIIQQGLNTKKGLRQVFILLFLPHQNIQLRSSQTEAKNQYQFYLFSSNEVELSVFTYYLPVYEKIINQKELGENFKEWLYYFLDVLHYRNQSATTKVFTLDSIEITELNQIPLYDKFIYLQLQGQFDFWNIIKDQVNLSGDFQVEKYPKLATKLLDLKTKDEIIRFFLRRENLLPFYFRPPQLGSQVGIPSQYQIEVESDIKEPNEEMFQHSIIQMNEKEQETYLKVLQQYIHSNKSKYSNKLKNLEETMRLRLKNIKLMRRQSIQVRLKSKKFIKVDEEEHFERRLLQEDEKSIEEIKEDALDHIHPQNTHIFKKKVKQISNVEDPFQSFGAKDNQKFREIMQLVNVEKIVLEKNLTRQDIYHYLSLFKALMDSDAPTRIKDVKYPTLFISLDQLRRGVPFIALYKNKVNTKKLAEVYNRKYNYCEFMEFLDIFTTDYKVTEQELQEMDEEIIYSQAKQNNRSILKKQESSILRNENSKSPLKRQQSIISRNESTQSPLRKKESVNQRNDNKQSVKRQESIILKQ